MGCSVPHFSPRLRSESVTAVHRQTVVPVVFLGVVSCRAMRRFTLETEGYLAASQRWPAEGKVILAQFDEDSVVVYQAYNSAIAAYAVQQQRFDGGPGYRPDRMTWIKVCMCGFV